MLSALTDKYHQFSNNHPNLTALAWIVLAGLAAFGIMLPRVGFYGDDWCYLWLLFKGAGIELYFRSSRSVLAPIFTTLAALLGDQPLAWQVYSLCVRMLCAFLFWKVLAKIWPNLQKYALLTAILWLVYPGYRLAYVSMNMSIFFVVLSCYFLSIYLQLLSINNARFRWVLILASLVLAYINITFTEYYFFAELVRPVFLCLFLLNQNLSWKDTIKKTALAWIPFFILFFGAVLWRAFFQSKINSFYTLKLLDDFKANPLPTILNQIVQMAQGQLDNPHRRLGKRDIPCPVVECSAFQMVLLPDPPGYPVRVPIPRSIFSAREANHQTTHTYIFACIPVDRSWSLVDRPVRLAGLAGEIADRN